MNRFKGPLLIGFIVFTAFLWGYKRDSYSATLHEMKQKVVSLGKKKEQPPARETAPQKSSPAPKEPPRMPVQNPANPYERLSGSIGVPLQQQGPNAMVESLNSAAPGAIDTRQVIQRNAYFEKLSQQLRELKGEEPQKQKQKDRESSSQEPEPQPTELPTETLLPQEQVAPLDQEIVDQTQQIQPQELEEEDYQDEDQEEEEEEEEY